MATLKLTETEILYLERCLNRILRLDKEFNEEDPTTIRLIRRLDRLVKDQKRGL